MAQKEIEFIESGELLDRTVVKVGDRLRFEAEEADAYVNNGKAVYVTDAPVTTVKRQKGEVTNAD